MFVSLKVRMDAEDHALTEPLVVATVATVLLRARAVRQTVKAAAESSLSRWRSDRNAA